MFGQSKSLIYEPVRDYKWVRKRGGGIKRDKGNCQNMKKNRMNVEERGWEKHQEVLDSGRTSLVQLGARL